MKANNNNGGGNNSQIVTKPPTDSELQKLFQKVGIRKKELLDSPKEEVHEDLAKTWLAELDVSDIASADMSLLQHKHWMKRKAVELLNLQCIYVPEETELKSAVELYLTQCDDDVVRVVSNVDLDSQQLAILCFNRSLNQMASHSTASFEKNEQVFFKQLCVPSALGGSATGKLQAKCKQLVADGETAIFRDLDQRNSKYRSVSFSISSKKFFEKESDPANNTPHRKSAQIPKSVLNNL